MAHVRNYYEEMSHEQLVKFIGLDIDPSTSRTALINLIMKLNS